MSLIIGVVNLKGGIGKSTLVAHLAHSLTLRGHQVAAFDMDIRQKTLSYYEGALGEFEGAKTPIIECPAERLRQNLEEFRHADFIVLDCGGHDNEETREALLVADIVIVPTTLAGHDLKGTRDFEQTVRDAMNVNKKMEPYLLVTRMSKTARDRERDFTLRNCTRLGIFDTTIPDSKDIAAASDRVKTVFSTKPNSPGATACNALTDEILGLSNGH